MQPVYENLTQFFRILLGDYNPITYTAGNETIIPAGFAGVDWPYLVRALVFIVAIYSIFRLLGVILCK